MMVPENQVGVNKEFSFSQDPEEQKKIGVAEKGNIFSNFLNTNNGNRLNNRPQQQPLRGNINPPNRRFNSFNKPRFPGPPARPVHDVPGPPYRGPPPRNPNLPMDDTIIHPSIHRPRYSRPPRNFRKRLHMPQQPLYTTKTTFTTTTTPLPPTTTTEKSTTLKTRPSIIVVQQPGFNHYRPSPYGYNPYQPQYGYPQPGYQQPYLVQQPTTTTTVTTTTSTSIATTTTKRSRRRKKEKEAIIKSTSYELINRC